MFRSEYADVPPVELPIHDAVLARAAEFGDLPALIDGVDGTTLTYDQLDRFHRRIAASLAEAGVRKGDVLALHSPNTIAYPTGVLRGHARWCLGHHRAPARHRRRSSPSSCGTRPRAGSSPSHPLLETARAGRRTASGGIGRSSSATAPPGTVR